MITSATEPPPVRRTGHIARQGRRRMPSETPASEFLNSCAGSTRNSPARSFTSGHGQLRHTQTREGQGVVEASSPIRASLRSTSFQLAESGGEMVWPLDNKAIRRGVFRSVADLQSSIDAFLQAWNRNPKPFVWTATVESIQEKLARCRQTLEQIQPGCTSPKSRKRTKISV